MRLVDLLNEIRADGSYTAGELADEVKFLAQKVSELLVTTHQLADYLDESKFKFSSSVIPLGSLTHANSFEAALLFKVLADQLEIAASLHAPLPDKASESRLR